MGSAERNAAMEERAGTIFENGYGVIAKKVMMDKNLSIESKAIYSYLCSFAGSDDEAYPSVSRMMSDLNISKDRFYRHMTSLVESGYITKYRTRDSNTGLRHNNIYEIVYVL